MAELEAMAVNAIGRFVVLGVERIRDHGDDELSRLLGP